MEHELPPFEGFSIPNISENESVYTPVHTSTQFLEENTGTIDTQQDKSVYTPVHTSTQSEIVESDESVYTENEKCVHTHQELILEAEKEDFPDVVFDDRFTIEHHYQKNRETITVHYTMQMVASRVRQYKNKLAQSIEGNKSERVISNQRRWLEYWLGKRNELLNKAI